MTQDYPKLIAPPPELSDEQVGEWLIDDDYPWDPSEQAVITITPSRLKNVARQAYQAGADQELEACCDTLQRHAHWDLAVCELMADRRSKPPSLKERALQAWAAVEAGTDDQTAMAVIRRALEQLDD
jgi:hypothetical protein